MTEDNDGLLRPIVNTMARWRIKLLGQQLTDYEQLLREVPEAASILYKARWLDKTGYEDLDFDKYGDAIERMRILIDSHLDKKIDENVDEGKIFAEKFRELFMIIDPKNPAINRGNDRQEWQHTAIKNSLTNLRKHGLFYKMEKGETGNIYTIVPDSP